MRIVRQKEKKRNENDIVNIVRIMCALLVIAIHTKPFFPQNNDLYFGVQVIARVAVPVFFTYSGYFVFSSANSEKVLASIKKSIFNLLRSYISWSIIYTVYLFFSGKHFESIYKSVLFIWTYIKRFFFEGTSAHLWFILAEIYWLLIFFFLIKKGLNKLIIPITVTLFCIGTFVNGYAPFFKFDYNFHFLKNFFVRQYFYLPSGYLGLGYILAREKIRIKKGDINSLIFVFAALISIVLYLGEIYTRRYFMPDTDISFSFFQYCVVATLTLITLVYEKHLFSKFSLRQIGNLIYYSHVLIIYLLQRFSLLVFGQADKITGTALFGSCVIVSVVFASFMQNFQIIFNLKYSEEIKSPENPKK